MCQIEQSLLGLKLNESVLKQPSEAGCFREGSDAGGVLWGSCSQVFLQRQRGAGSPQVPSVLPSSPRSTCTR